MKFNLLRSLRVALLEIKIDFFDFFLMSIYGFFFF